MTTTRWAIIKRVEQGEHLDGIPREEVVDIQTREETDGPPPMWGLRNSSERNKYSVEQIDGVDVKIGMVRTADGFGWPSNIEVNEARPRNHAIGTKPRRIGPGPKPVQYGG